MDQDPNQAQPPYGPPAGAPQYPQYGPPGGPQYPSYGPPMGGPQYPQYGPPPGGPQYPSYGAPMGGPQYPPMYPPPSYPPEQPPKKSSKTWLWVLLGIVGFSLIACIIASVIGFAAFAPVISSSVQSTEATQTAISTQNNGDDGGDNIIHAVDIHLAPLGQAVTIQNVACTAISQKSIPGDSTATPKPGDEFVVLHIKLTNHSGQTQQYDAINFYVTDSTGRAILNSTLAPKAYAKQLSVGSIAPGQSVEGDLVFEIARSDHGQAFNWEPNFNVNPDHSSLGEWKLG